MQSNFVKVGFLHCRNHAQKIVIGFIYCYVFNYDARKKNYKGALSAWSIDEFFIEDCFVWIIKHSQIIFLYLCEVLWFKHKLRKLFFFYKSDLLSQLWNWTKHLKRRHIMNLLIMKFFCMYLDNLITSLRTHLRFLSILVPCLFSSSMTIEEMKEANLCTIGFLRPISRNMNQLNPFLSSTNSIIFPLQTHKLFKHFH